MEVVVTGMGAVTPYGCGVEALWQGLLDGRSAISEMDLFDLGGMSCTHAGVVRGYEVPVDGSGLTRGSGFAAGAVMEALEQAGVAGGLRGGTGLIAASNFGEFDKGELALIPEGDERHDVSAAAYCAHGKAAERLAGCFELGGVVLALSLSCASGASAAATAATMLRQGVVRRMVVVGYDALSLFSWSGLCSLRTMTRGRVAPFDRERSGTIFSEGAAALVLERRDEAEGRGAEVLAEFSGWASGNNGHHMTAPAPRGAGSADVMRRALESAGVGVREVDHINAHGTATKPNDLTESQAINDVFGGRAGEIPVTSVKGLLGHMLGGAGIVELVVAVLSLQRGVIPPTGNLEQQDPECELDVVREVRELELGCVVSNSAGFGGCNAAVVLRATGRLTGSDSDTAVTAELQRVVISGVGAISPLGLDLDEIVMAVAEGEPCAGEAPEPELAECGVAPKPYLDRASKLFMAACGMAIEQGGLGDGGCGELHAGILCGTTWGCLGTAEMFFADCINKGPRLVKPFLFPHAYPNTAISLAAMEWSLKGEHENVVGGESASGVALALAHKLVKGGRAQVLLAGGCDALSATRERGRSGGGELAEGAAVLVVESEASARERGAEVQGYLLGSGMAVEVEQAVELALQEAGLSGGEIGRVYVNSAAAEGVAGYDEVVNLEELCGDLAGATTALHVAIAVAEERGAVMVVTGGEGVSVALVVEAGGS